MESRSFSDEQPAVGPRPETTERRIGGKGKGNRYIKSTFGPSGAFPSRFHQYIARDTLTSIINTSPNPKAFSTFEQTSSPRQSSPDDLILQHHRQARPRRVLRKPSEVLACSGQTSTLACWNAGWEQPDPSGPGGCPYGASVLCCSGDPLTQTNPRPSCIYPNGAIFHVPSHPKRFKL
ncbi:hypothetical protein PSHT_04141 [Puccinia striiformis]|uniref:Uncharacterized protein n=1 Tax=Puccinia striiformis TaxID=27350 RepID=A0A2S4WDV6_9BASI|nr:hypothetical protein PSHT_04141 [Puccinia striiformis]